MVFPLEKGDAYRHSFGLLEDNDTTPRKTVNSDNQKVRRTLCDLEDVQKHLGEYAEKNPDDIEMMDDTESLM